MFLQRGVLQPRKEAAVNFGCPPVYHGKLRKIRIFVRKKASFLRLFFLNIMVLRKSDNSIVNLIKKSLFYHFSVSTSTMYLSSSHSKSHSPSYVSSGSVRVSSYPSWNNTPSVYGDSSSEITNLISASIPFVLIPSRY